MHARTTWLLLLIAVALGAYVWGVDRRADTTAERRQAGRLAFAVKADRVTSVALEVGTLRLRAAQEPDGPWMLTQPVQARAEVPALRRLLISLEILPRGEVITAADRARYGTTLDDYGLRTPRARIEIGVGSATQTFLVGAPSPDGASLYVQEASSDDIVSTSTSLLAALPDVLGAWRDRTLFFENAARIQRVELRRPDGFLQLQRRKDGQWAIQQPIPARADPLAVAALLENLLAIRVADFVQDGVDNTAAFGIDETSMEIALTDDRPNGLPTVLRLGRATTAEAKMLYAWTPGDKNAYTVDASVLEVLRVKIDDLRSRVLLPMPVDRVRRMQFKRGEKELVLERGKDLSWALSSPIKAAADAERVRQVLQDLQSARVRTFIELPGASVEEYGLGADADRVELSDGAAGTNAVEQVAAPWSVVLRLGRRVGGMQLVQVEGESAACEVPEEAFRLVSLRPIAFRTREVFQMDPDQVQRISLTRGDVEETVARDAEGQFTVANASGVRVRTDTLRAQLETLRRVVAVCLVDDQAPSLVEYGLDPPLAVMTLGLTGEAGLEKSMLLGRVTEGGVFAMIRGQDLVFVLDPVFAALLQRSLYVKQDAAGGAPTAP